MNLKEIKKIDWRYLINRKETFFFHSNADNSYRYFKKLTGIAWSPDYILRESDGDYYTTPETINNFCSVFAEGGVSKFYDFRKKLIYNIKQLDDYLRKIEKTNYAKLTKQKLSQELAKYLKLITRAECFLLPMPLADKILSETILNKLPTGSDEQKQKWLGILSYPAKENEHTKEKRSLYKLALAYKNKKKNFNDLVADHLKKFSWIGGRYLWNYGWEKNDIIDRLENFIQTGRNPQKELAHLDEVRNKVDKDLKKLIKQLKIKRGSSLYNLILLAKEFAYLRTWRTDVIYQSFYAARNIFYEIADRAAVNRDDIDYLTSDEIMEMAKFGKIPVAFSELSKRKEYYVKVVANNKNYIFSGKDWKDKIGFLNQKAEKINVIKGVIAYPGKIKGIARIVKTNKDISKVNKGDILISIMTFPHLVPAMEKASAFVTDEGGILCHAAIVAREMNKPCIIGTKIATKVLRDGDLVEVDAERGIVNIIKRVK